MISKRAKENLLKALWVAVSSMTGCAPYIHFSLIDKDVAGAMVTSVIDRSLGAQVRHTYPELKVGPSTCSDRVDLSDDKVATCKLPVDGIAIPVKVAADRTQKRFKVAFYGTLYSMQSIERETEANWLLTYGRRARITCGSPRVRVYTADTRFSCAVASIPGLKIAQFKALESGQYFTYTPASFHTETEAWLLQALSRHKRGLNVVVKGSDVGKYIDIGLESAVAASVKTPPHFGRARCPARIDLTGGRTGQCLVAFEGRDARYKIWIRPVQGFFAKRIDAVIDFASLAQGAADDINRRLTDAGLTADAIVGCGTGYTVVQPPAVLYCDARAGGKTTRLEFTVKDANGTSTFHGIKQD